MRPLCCLMLFAGWFPLVLPAAPVPKSGTQSPPSRPPAANRFLFVVETSAAMARFEHAGRQAVFDLIHSGLEGRIRKGDSLGVWTFTRELQAGAFPLQTWDPANSVELASRVGRFLRNQRYGRFADVNVAITNALALAKSIKDVNIFIISSGTGEWDDATLGATLAEAWQEKVTAAREAGQPVILTLAARRGKIETSEVLLAGEPVNLPLSEPAAAPVLPASAMPTNAPGDFKGALVSIGDADENPPTEPETAAPAPPAPAAKGTGAPIFMQGPSRRSDPAAAAVQAEPSAPATPGVHQDAAPAAIATVPSPPAEEARASAIAVTRSSADSRPSPATPAGAAALPATNLSQAIPPQTTVAARTEPAAVPALTAAIVGLAEPIPVAARGRESGLNRTETAPVEIAAAGVAQPARSARGMFLTGGGLLLVALGLIVVLVRRTQAPLETSFITRSMQGRQ